MSHKLAGPKKTEGALMGYLMSCECGRCVS